MTVSTLLDSLRRWSALVSRSIAAERDPSPDVPESMERARAEMQALASAVDERLPTKLRQLDELIRSGEREIIRLQRRLAVEEALSRGSVSLTRVRQPDLLHIVRDDREVLPLPAAPKATPPHRRAA